MVLYHYGFAHISLSRFNFLYFFGKMPMLNRIDVRNLVFTTTHSRTLTHYIVEKYTVQPGSRFLSAFNSNIHR